MRGRYNNGGGYAAPGQQLQPMRQASGLMMGAVPAPTMSPALPAPQPPSTNYHHLVPPGYEEWNKIPAWYTVTINLGPNVGDTGSNSKTLRPERFVLGRVTWSTSGDVFDLGPDSPGPVSVIPLMASIQARCVEMEWQDEFTRFMGNSPTLVSSQFGDSNGFLDMPAGLLFQGKQTLSVKLSRIKALTNDVAARWDFSFQGLSLLPPNVEVSGSAR